jgi:iron complex transport system permease protein
LSAGRPALAAPGDLLGIPRLTWAWTAIGLAGLAGALCVGVLVGPVRISPADLVWSLLAALHVRGAGLADPGQASILWSLRLPRVVLGAIVGGMLATAGASYQGVFRNPLADPYLLGAAAGAELGATLAIAFAPAASPAWVNAVPVAAFAGATLAVAGAYALSRTVTGSRNPTALILAGVAIASFLNAVQIYVQQVQSTSSFRQVYSWILGRLVTAGWDGVGLIAPYVGVSLAVILAHRWLLDTLAVGDEEAATLGISARRIRLVVVAAATLGTAAAVAVAGTIAFVGIIVPHTVRLLVGRSYRVVIPLSMLGGASFLVLADSLARTVTAPAEVPIGVITALVGAPFFIVVMRSTRTAEM